MYVSVCVDVCESVYVLVHADHLHLDGTFFWGIRCKTGGESGR